MSYPTYLVVENPRIEEGRLVVDDAFPFAGNDAEQLARDYASALRAGGVEKVYIYIEDDEVVETWGAST